MGRSEKITGEKSGAVEPARRKAALKPVHPARPAEGDVDYAALRSDLKAKFPKTIARLAK